VRVGVRTRLTLTFAAGMLVVLVSLGAFLYLQLGSDLMASIDQGLRSRGEAVSAAAEHSGRFPAQSGRLIDPDEAFAQVLDASGRIVDSSPIASGTPLVSPTMLRSIRGATLLDRVIPGINPARLLVIPRGPPSQRLFVVVGATLSDRTEALTRLLVLLAIGGPVTFVVTSAAAWLLAGAALRPAERMRAQAAAITDSNPSRRLAVPKTGDELERLAVTLNDMLERLHDSVSRERRFVDDASHELRTPLSLLKGELDLAMSRPRTREELERALSSASSDADRLARLAEDLLVIARAGDGRLPVHRINVPLRDMIETSCRAFADRLAERDARVEIDAPEEAVCIDPVRARQALENLIDNAVRHVPRGGSIRVSGERDDEAVRLTVSDTGPGFPDGFAEAAFEPFARAGGQDDSTGAGLGLSIVRAIATAHDGVVVADNAPDGGARVQLTLAGAGRRIDSQSSVDPEPVPPTAR
jgi:two-component system, OmpR family, sensor kinase